MSKETELTEEEIAKIIKETKPICYSESGSCPTPGKWCEECRLECQAKAVFSTVEKYRRSLPKTTEGLKLEVAKEMAWQEFRGGEKFPTKAATWKWIVKMNFVEEWLKDADHLLSLISGYYQQKTLRELGESLGELLEAPMSMTDGSEHYLDINSIRYLKGEFLPLAQHQIDEAVRKTIDKITPELLKRLQNERWGNETPEWKDFASAIRLALQGEE